MHFAAANACLCGIVLGTGVSVYRRSRVAGWFTIAVSLIWFPLNNQVLEGAVLVTVSSRHGLTVSDLLGLAGFAAGVLTVWPPSTWRADAHSAMRLVGLVGLLLAAFWVAAIQTNLAVY
jgi:hypothetical protein